MTFRQESKQRKKDKAFKEFDYQALSKGGDQITYKNLADRFGVTVSTISKWRTEWIKKVCD
ncbi:MAG: hypothetical protein AAB922_00925 [Patescibacteria group bacterium]